MYDIEFELNRTEIVNKIDHISQNEIYGIELIPGGIIYPFTPDMELTGVYRTGGEVKELLLKFIDLITYFEINNEGYINIAFKEA